MVGPFPPCTLQPGTGGSSLRGPLNRWNTWGRSTCSVENQGQWHLQLSSEEQLRSRTPVHAHARNRILLFPPPCLLLHTTGNTIQPVSKKPQYYLRVKKNRKGGKARGQDQATVPSPPTRCMMVRETMQYPNRPAKRLVTWIKTQLLGASQTTCKWGCLLPK